MPARNFSAQKPSGPFQTKSVCASGKGIIIGVGRFEPAQATETFVDVALHIVTIEKRPGLRDGHAEQEAITKMKSSPKLKLDWTAKVIEMRSGLKIARAMVASILIGSPAVAQTIGYGEAIRGLTAACGADIEKHCKGVKPGGGAISSCLAKNNISTGCAATYVAAFALLTVRAAAQEAAPQICEADAKRLCANFREGRARVLRCLIRDDNIRKVSNKCNQAITDAGWR